MSTKTNKTNRNVSCNVIVRVLLGFGMFLIWIIASIQLGFSVEVADVCYDPNHAVLQAVNISTNPTNDTWNIVKYYVYCDSEHSYNPLIRQTQYAYNELAPLNSTIKSLVNEAKSCGISVKNFFFFCAWKVSVKTKSTRVHFWQKRKKNKQNL